MATNNIINKVRKWPIEKKRFFSIFFAVFLTIIIIILNFALNLLWKDDTPKINYAQNQAISSMKESFSNVFNKAGPVLEQAFGSTSEIIDQINSTSSSLAR